MTALDYPELQSHRLEHQRLLEQAAALSEAAVSEELPLSSLLNFVVQDVILNHMFKYDRKYYPFLRPDQQPAHRDSPSATDEAS